MEIGARWAAETLMRQKAEIYCWKEERTENGICTRTLVRTASDIPCRISYGAAGAGKAQGEEAADGLEITLFTPVGTQLPFGCRVVVDGRWYGWAGHTRQYQSHQETNFQMGVKADERGTD